MVAYAILTKFPEGETNHENKSWIKFDSTFSLSHAKYRQEMLFYSGWADIKIVLNKDVETHLSMLNL